MKKSFTLIELLVVTAIIAVLAAMLLPALSRARATAYSAQCRGNLQQIAIAFSIYARDNSDFLPRASGGSDPNTRLLSWYEALAPYFGSPSDSLSPGKFKCDKVKQCPSVVLANPDWRTYKMNALLEIEGCPYYRLGFHGNESEDVDTILLFDGIVSRPRAAMESSGDRSFVDIRHKNGVNVLFLDGHVLWESLQSLKPTPKGQRIYWDARK